MNYRIFKRKAYRRENGKYVPNGGARKTTVTYVSDIDEARLICSSGPANVALKQDKEYRGLCFYEFESC